MLYKNTDNSQINIVSFCYFNKLDSKKNTTACKLIYRMLMDPDSI